MITTGSGADAPADVTPRKWPRFVKVEHHGGTLVIRWRHVQVDSLISLFMLSLLGPGLVPLILAGALSSPLWFMKVFGVLEIALLLGLLYAIAANLVNGSVLSITPDRLELKSGPLPWIAGNLYFPAEEVAAISCREKIRYHSRPASTDYRLELLTRTGRGFPILRPFAKQEDAEAMRALIVEQPGRLKANVPAVGG